MSFSATGLGMSPYDKYYDLLQDHISGYRKVEDYQSTMPCYKAAQRLLMKDLKEAAKPKRKRVRSTSEAFI